MNVLDKQGIAISRLVAIGLGLAVLLGLLLLWGDTQKIVAGTLNACEERGGRCIPDGTCTEDIVGENARPMLEHNGACEEAGEICCKIPDEKSSEREAIPGTRTITVAVGGRGDPYENTEDIPLYAGKKYSFTINVDNEYKDNKCRAYLKDGETDAIIKEILKNKKCSKFPITYEKTFEEKHIRQDLELDIIVYKKDAEEESQTQTKSQQGQSQTQTSKWKTSAKLQLAVRDPISITAPGDWRQKATVTVTCSQCQSIDNIRFVNKQENCYKDQKQNDQTKKQETSKNQESSEFSVSQLTTSGDTYKYEVRGNGSAAVCVDATTVDGQKIYSLAGQDGIVRVDNQPPEISISKEALENPNTPNVLKIQCDDNELSGCTKYYRHFLTDINTGGLRGDVRSAKQKAAEATVGDFLDLLNSNFLSFTGQVDISACDNALVRSSDYRTIREPRIGVSGKMYGAVCVYAKDKAGNVAKPTVEAFKNPAYIRKLLQDAKEEVREIKITTILATLG